MLPQILAVILVIIACLMYAGFFIQSYQAYKEWGVGKKGWLRRSVMKDPSTLARTPEGWQEYEKAVKHYYSAIGAVNATVVIVIFIIAYYLWNA